MISNNAIKDAWADVESFRKYSVILRQISIIGVSTFNDINVPIASAISSICGRNGIGKTSLLKMIYYVLTKNERYPLKWIKYEDLFQVRIELKIRGKDVVYTGDPATSEYPFPVEYFNASRYASSVLDSIEYNTTGNWEFEGEEYAFSEEQLWAVRYITGKKYDEIIVKNILPDTGIGNSEERYSLPYFTVAINEIKYSNDSMGEGEHKALILAWKLFSLEANTIFLLEEPESFICPMYQSKIIDFLVFFSAKNKISVIMNTHSEHILNSQAGNSKFILYRASASKFGLVKADSEYRYKKALGLSQHKNILLLVEDNFAMLFLDLLLKMYAESFSERAQIIALNGESDIQEIAKRLVYDSKIKVIAVYDADQRIHDFDTRHLKLPVLFLPAELKIPPEKVVISYIEDNIEKFSEFIRYDKDRFEAALSAHVRDHHDWFIELQKELRDIDLFSLKVSSIKFWLENNINLCKKFAFELNNVRSEISGTLVIEESDNYVLFEDELKYKVSSQVPAEYLHGNTVKCKFNCIGDETTAVVLHT